MRLDGRLVESAAAWDEALRTLPDAHPLQSWAWGAFKSRWGWEMLPTLFFEQGGERPVAAAMLLKRPLPRTPFSILYAPKGPLFAYEDRPLGRALLAALAEIGRRERAILVKIDPDIPRGYGEENEPAPAGQAFIAEMERAGWRFSAEQIQFRNTVTLDLTRSEEELLGAMKQKTRYNVRLAGRKGVTVRPGTPEDFETIFELYQETAERDEFLIRPAAYYEDAWRTLYDAGQACPFIAEYEGLPLGAVIVVRYGPKAIYMYGASTQRERNRMPNYLLQWEAIRWSKAQGAAVYDFWGAPDEFVESDSLWGVWQFKRGFDGTVVHHVGAWDYPVSRPLYWLFTRALPRYRALLRGQGASSFT